MPIVLTKQCIVCQVVLPSALFDFPNGHSVQLKLPSSAWNLPKQSTVRCDGIATNHRPEPQGRHDLLAAFGACVPLPQRPQIVWDCALVKVPSSDNRVNH